ALDGEIRLSMTEVELYGEYFPEGEVVAWMEGGRFTLERLELRRPRARGEESLYARGSIGKGYATNLEIVAGGVRLEQLDNLIRRDVPLSGDVLLDVHVGGTLMEPEPSGRLALRNSWLANRPLDETTVFFETDDGTMQIAGGVAGHRLGLEGWIELWDAQRYAIFAALDDFPMHVLYPEAPDGTPVRSLVGGRIAVSGAAEEPVTIDATIETASLEWEGHDLRSEKPWRFTQDGTAFTLRDVSLVGGETAVAFGGTRRADGTLLFAGGGVLDLDLLRLVVPDMTAADGVADLNLSITGSAGDVRPVVDATLSDAMIEGGWFPHPIESIDGRLSAAPDGYDIREMTGRLGGGELAVSGRIDAENWRPTRYDLSADLDAARVRYLDFLPPITGDAALTISGPANDLLMSGDITVHEMLFADRIDWESWVLELSEERLVGAVSAETDDLFSMDITVTADDTIRMRNNVADLTAGGKLTIIGDTSRPGVIGFVRAQPGGRVLLKERNFELLRGELNFVEPFSFDPDVDISMNTTISTRERDVSVDYQVLGRYSDWYAQTSSDPPLAQADINALLLFGMTREELERYGGLSSALLIESGDLFASKFGLVERVGEGIFQYDIFRLDRVDLVSGVSERGLAVTSELRVLAEKDIGEDTRLTLEQNLNRVDDTYLSLEQRLARRLYLRGYWATEQEGRYMEIGGAYGLDFNLRWELD
ncbi:MAG: autotransporter translocation and assembly factor TamB, partial [Myxococcota bacterium]